MSDDWKKHIDEWELRKAEEARKAAQERLAKEEAARRAEYERHLKQLQKRFKCHICDEPTKCPNLIKIDGNADAYWDATVYKEDWTLPGDLWKCKLCGKWTCNKHIHKGICENCAKDLR